MPHPVTVNANGVGYTHTVEPRLLLGHYLRDVLGLTGISEDLLDAIHGGGAFRRFKNVIFRRELEEAWYRFRDRALADIAVEWLEENGPAYARNLETAVE